MTWTDLLPDGTTAQVGGDVDIDELTELIRREEEAIEGKSLRTTTDTSYELSRPDFDADTELAMIRDSAGAMVAAAMFNQTDPRVSSFTNLWADPSQDPLAIRRPLVEWAMHLATSRIALAPEGAQVAMAIGAHANNSAAISLFAELGFHEERFFLEMVRQLDGPVQVPPLPKGIALRTLGPDDDVDGLAAAVADAFRDHFGFTEQPLEVRIERWRHLRRQDDWDDSLVWLAEDEDEDEIAAVNACLAHHGTDETEGYVASLGVRRPWRGRGLAKAMLLEAFAEYERRGKTSVSLHVDADSITGATKLYEDVGMVEVNRYADYELVLRPGEDLTVR